MRPMKPSPPAQGELVQACMQSLRRVVKALEAYSRSVEKRFDLTGPQLWALWELGHGGPMALKDLAARMRLEPSTVVGVVDRLVVKGLVTRNPDSADRRRISLMPTSQGQSLLQQAPHPAQGHLLAGLESLESKRVQDLHAALQTLEKVLHAEDLEAPFFFAER